MELLLRTNVEHLGRTGEVVEVKPGYARNYLRINGAWQDHLLFALLASDCLGNKKPNSKYYTSEPMNELEPSSS